MIITSFCVQVTLHGSGVCVVCQRVSYRLGPKGQHAIYNERTNIGQSLSDNDVVFCLRNRKFPRFLFLIALPYYSYRTYTGLYSVGGGGEGEFLYCLPRTTRAPLTVPDRPDLLKAPNIYNNNNNNIFILYMCACMCEPRAFDATNRQKVPSRFCINLNFNFGKA